MTNRYCLYPLSMTLLTTPALGNGATPPTIGPGELLSVGTGLVLVIGAILLCGWLYARTSRLRHGATDLIRVIASQPLGAKERVVLLQVADQQLLVGMTSSNVQTLHVFEEPLKVDALPQGGFAERLRAAVKGEGR